VLRGWKEIRSSWETIFRNTKYLEIETEIIATENNIAYVVLMEVTQVVAGSQSTINGYKISLSFWLKSI